MNNDLITIDYSCRRRVTDYCEIGLARKREADHNILSGRDKVYALYKALGFDVGMMKYLPIDNF